MAYKNPLPTVNLSAKDIADTIGLKTNNLSKLVVWARVGGKQGRAFSLIENGGTLTDGWLIEGAEPYWNIYSINSPGRWSSRGLNQALPSEDTDMFGSVLDFQLERAPSNNFDIAGNILQKTDYILNLGSFAGYNNNTLPPSLNFYTNNNGWSVRFNLNGWSSSTSIGDTGGVNIGAETKFCVCINNNAYALTKDGGQFIGSGTHILTTGTHIFDVRLGTYVGVAGSPDPHIFLKPFGYIREEITVHPEDTERISFSAKFNDGSSVGGIFITARSCNINTGAFSVSASTQLLPVEEISGPIYYDATLVDGSHISGFCINISGQPLYWALQRNMDQTLQGGLSGYERGHGGGIAALSITLESQQTPPTGGGIH